MRIIYLILKVLYEENAKNKVNAITQKEIEERLENKSEKLCEKTVYNKLRKMLTNGYIKEGMKYVNAKTYYISIEGIEFMKEMEFEEVE